MENKLPEVASEQFLDLDSDWGSALAPHGPGRGRLKGFFDGASRGNPGEAGAGALLLDEGGASVWKCARPLGVRTNNEAEYLALILLLEEVARRGIPADIFGDSSLVVNQVTGKWKIKEPRLRDLADRAAALLKTTLSTLAWIPREQNSRADRLSNEALDNGGITEKAVPPEKPAFPPEKLEQAGKHIFIAHGSEDYAVDTLYLACTCRAFQRYRRCKHLDAALKRPGK